MGGGDQYQQANLAARQNLKRRRADGEGTPASAMIFAVGRTLTPPNIIRPPRG